MHNDCCVQICARTEGFYMAQTASERTPRRYGWADECKVSAPKRKREGDRLYNLNGELKGKNNE